MSSDNQQYKEISVSEYLKDKGPNGAAELGGAFDLVGSLLAMRAALEGISDLARFTLEDTAQKQGDETPSPEFAAERAKWQAVLDAMALCDQMFAKSRLRNEQSPSRSRN